ncbi:MAG: formyltransferase family protein [Ekhidna sp.]|nr:formyltransferase family protein [Ekhidna sp.]
MIVGENFKKLNLPKSTIRTKIKNGALIKTSDLAARFEIPYLNADHNSDELVKKLHQIKPRLGLIGGARIIDQKIIDCFSTGIINFHPGILPEVRGLDSMLWAILNGIDQGVSSHIIDRKVDAGSVIDIQKIEINRDDTIFDISEKLYSKQLDMIWDTYQKSLNDDFLDINFEGTKSYSKMPADLEQKLSIAEYIDSKGS